MSNNPGYQIPWNELSFHQQYDLKEAWIQHEKLKSELLKAEIMAIQAKAKAISEGKYNNDCSCSQSSTGQLGSWKLGTTCQKN